MNETQSINPEVTADAEQSIPKTTGEKAREIAETVSDYASQAKKRSSEYLNKGSEFIDRNSTRLGAKLESVSQAGPPLHDGIDATQRHIEDASSYLQSATPQDMLVDLIEIGRRHPRGAAGVLFVAGFMLARKLYS